MNTTVVDQIEKIKRYLGKKYRIKTLTRKQAKDEMLVSLTTLGRLLSTKELESTHIDHVAEYIVKKG